MAGEKHIQVDYNGDTTGFQVVQHGNFFEIAKDGKIIATLRHENGWQQVSGDRLPDDVIASIGVQIIKAESQA